MVIKGERPLVKVENGRLGYDLSALSEKQSVNNAYEAIIKLPVRGKTSRVGYIQMILFVEVIFQSGSHIVHPTFGTQFLVLHYFIYIIIQSVSGEQVCVFHSFDIVSSIHYI